jgi:hypothetical protein
MKTDRTCVPPGWTQRCIEALMRRDSSLPQRVAEEMATQMAGLGLWHENDPAVAVNSIFELTAVERGVTVAAVPTTVAPCLRPSFWNL